MLPLATVSLVPGQAGAAQLPKESHPQGTDLALCGPKLEMRVLDILQHCKTLYKPFRHLAALQDHLQTLPKRGCKAVFAGNGAVQWASAHRQVGRGYVPYLPSRDLQALLHPSPSPCVPFCPCPSVSPTGSCADGGKDAAWSITAHGGSTHLQKAPACWGEHRHLRALLPGFTGLPDGIKDRLSLWLGRLTAQWSVEDEEEAARERRRREREKQLRSQAEEGLNGTVPCSESAALAQENQ